MRFILKYIKPVAGRFALGMSVKFIGTLMDLLIPSILAYIIDTVTPMGDVNRVILWGGLMLACSVSAWLLNVFANRMAATVARDVTRSVLSSRLVYK